jgi:hypothetical protein
MYPVCDTWGFCAIGSDDSSWWYEIESTYLLADRARWMSLRRAQPVTTNSISGGALLIWHFRTFIFLNTDPRLDQVLAGLKPPMTNWKWTRVNVCMHVYVFISLYVWIYMCACMYVCMYVYDVHTL